MKGVISSLVASTLLAASLPAQALQLNVVSAHPYDVDLEYHLYFSEKGQIKENSQKMNGFQASAFPEWVAAFNSDMANQHPGVSLTGEVSWISFGYRKERGGPDIFPQTCTRIPLKEVTTITLNEAGCTVSQ